MRVTFDGNVKFNEKTFFTGNKAPGSYGGAIYSQGTISFKKNSSFNSNYANGNSRLSGLPPTCTTLVSRRTKQFLC